MGTATAFFTLLLTLCYRGREPIFQEMGNGGACLIVPQLGFL